MPGRGECLGPGLLPVPVPTEWCMYHTKHSALMNLSSAALPEAPEWLSRNTQSTYNIPAQRSSPTSQISGWHAEGTLWMLESAGRSHSSSPSRMLMNLNQPLPPFSFFIFSTPVLALSQNHYWNAAPLEKKWGLVSLLVSSHPPLSNEKGHRNKC